jgi:hypothetical protein
MSCGGGFVVAECGSQKPTPAPAPAPASAHPRYVPRRGAVLKRIVSGALRCFLFQANGLVPGSVVGGRVSPAPPDMLGGGGAAEQAK